jgi:hypothetical protein
MAFSTGEHCSVPHLHGQQRGSGTETVATWLIGMFAP